MHKKVSKSLAMSVVAGIVALAGASAAFASGSFAVTAWSATSGTVVGYSATTIGTSPQVTFKDTTGGITINCASASAAGSVTVGSGLDSDHLGTIDGTATTMSTCTWQFGPFAVTGSNTWYLDATGSTASGVTPIRISGVNMHFASSSCTYDVTGAVDGTYTNGSSTGTLNLPGTASGLIISGVSGPLCALANIANGHVVSLRATYGVTANTSSYNPITINGVI